MYYKLSEYFVLFLEYSEAQFNERFYRVLDDQRQLEKSIIEQTIAAERQREKIQML